MVHHMLGILKYMVCHSTFMSVKMSHSDVTQGVTFRCHDNKGKRFIMKLFSVNFTFSMNV